MNRAHPNIMGVVAFSFSTVFAHADAPSFHGLGQVPGGKFSYAYSVSADGSTVVGRARVGSGWEAFRWTTSDGMISLGDLPGGDKDGWAYGVSGDGKVVAGTGNSGAAEAFRWTAADGMQGLGDLPGGNTDSYGYGISGDGRVIVGRSGSADGTEAFRWTAEDGMVALGDFNQTHQSGALAASHDGSVIVGYGRAKGQFKAALRWTDDGDMLSLGRLPGGDDPCQANDVSGDGSVIVGYGTASDHEWEAFRWTETDGMVGLGRVNGWKSSVALGISGDGQMIVGGGIDRDTSASLSFLWDQQSGIRDLKTALESEYGLDLGDWQLSSATDISRDGRTIVGIGGHEGVTEAWIAQIPEPSTMFLVLGGALCLRRRF